MCDGREPFYLAVRPCGAAAQHVEESGSLADAMLEEAGAISVAAFPQGLA